MGTIALHEGYNSTQKLIEAYRDDTQGRKVIQNDKVRTLKLNNVKSGCQIVVLYSPYPLADFDFCVIDVKKKVEEYTIDLFTKTYCDDIIRTSYIRNGFTDAKVSYIVIQ